ncbi:hypothetical protein OEW28_18765 [Defluviimonas sp. WL0002]|uniref:Uncharacterized protein n=1 Tax=Albidovulum marisflavi TaxID=2984159 RepID=A0ABT2ZHP6_9RHOB|nr:hypothetical protein [Defluviimonas sp. WL0002]MCV2870660.1 hypothetical protein [Defluviimonas sp. WL0002]
MLSQTLDPLNPRHRAGVLAAAGIGAALAVLVADLVIPALVAGGL